MPVKVNRLRTLSADSVADTEKTHTITQPSAGPQRRILIHWITVSTRGGDIAADAEIIINDNGVRRWRLDLRSAKVFGGHILFAPCPIVIQDGDCTIVTGEGGANVIVSTSVGYEVY